MVCDSSLPLGKEASTGRASALQQKHQETLGKEGIPMTTQDQLLKVKVSFSSGMLR